ncbi:MULTISPECIES: nickel efflux RND transporter permease subunit CnrA [Cupriavidus]|uniref:Nickel and cobalt resistance protein CnrA n=1 Tax=Cupriavidus metallidurans (strain ATCC 43123 / DSM 2839 / NBRC 102507 / CH34) TaxID=266264 RepID=CNRA_CUPMC|nr:MULTISPECIES: nickel efflux RND transporter permease subunit CnrA [Cupriavidus]P37972.2 RecName: Full=Nickel and cobalt resistance protein CnrA [Cupriavidus metallidurans CH34]ABF13069.1 CnrA, inner membrane efflux pump,three components cation proton antiporter efflux system, involved in Co(II), Ni(II) resistance [Cupriavidus metallidurans CH34]MBY4732225.1 nickel efflux RND transporter permease subunit CnrA [Cupriavidus pauculus]MCM3608745.1 nickel efflux RND transporter permease subunit Cn
MIESILSGSVRYRWLVLFLTAVVAVIGAWQLNLLPIDVTPDITNKQVQINSVVPTMSPVEVEKRVTYPIETAIAGLNGVESTRSMSRNGFSQVTVIFKESANLYFMRQQVSERLAQARPNLPENVEPQMGPVSTGLGEVFHYSVEYQYPDGTGASIKDGEPGWQSDGSFLTERGERLDDRVSRLAYLRTVQDWIIRPQLRTTPGVADVDSLGGYVKQFVVEPDTGKMAAYGVSYADLARALEDTNLSVGANFIRRSGESYLVRADARIKSADEISRAVIAQRQNVPITVGQVARVKIGGELRSGAASRNGNETVVGSALMLVGANSRTVAQAVGDKLEQISKTLPPGVVIVPTLNRSQLVIATIETVAKNLIEGALLVVAILFALLGNWRAATIAALVIPLSLLVSAIGMNQFHISGNLMSLGALDFGLIIDGAVIIVENSLRRLAERQHREGRLLTLDERLQEVVQSSREMVRPTVYGQLVIFMVFLPCLTFQGVEGKMFSPMVITLMLALASAFVLSLTFVPAMVAVMLRKKVAETEVRVIVATKESYRPWLEHAVARPMPFIGAGIATVAVATVAFTFVGREFMPTLDELNLNLSSVRIPSTSIDQSVAIDLPLERAVLSLPEVQTVYSKAGTASLAADPMPPNASDNYIILKPKSEWPEGVTTKEQVIERIREKTAPMVGNNYDVTQPIEMRFNELIGGVRSDVAVKVYGENLDELAATAQRIAAVLKKTPGATDVRVPLTSGFPTFDIVFDRAAIARYGLTVKEVADTISTAMAGRPAGQIFDGDRRFDIVIRLPGEQRENLDVLGALPVMLPLSEGQARASVPLRQLVQFRFTQGLNEVSRDNGKRRVYVEANVGGRDLGSFVDDAAARIAKEVKLPPGMYIEWGGQFQNLQAATKRLAIIVPLCFILIAATLYMAIGSAALTATVLTAVPLALAGGVFALLLRGIPFSISAAVGFIAVSGVAVLNGLVLISAIRKRLDDGMAPDAAVIEGAMERVRPVLMTALVASLGFVPMAIATGTGAEVQKPLATVVIGGLVTATVLTLFVLPALCGIVLKRRTAGRPEAQAALEA